MKKQDALSAVARAAKSVPAIDGIEFGGNDGFPTLALSVKDGRTINVVPDYGYNSGWPSRHSEDRADRVLLRAGDLLDNSAVYGYKSVTRTFRVRGDGTLNEKGIAKALGELAALQVEDVVRRAKREAERAQKDDQRAETREKLQAIVGGFERKWGDELGNTSTLADVGELGLKVDLSVLADGRVDLRLPDLTSLQVLQVLKILGHAPVVAIANSDD